MEADCHGGSEHRGEGGRGTHTPSSVWRPPSEHPPAPPPFFSLHRVVIILQKVQGGHVDGLHDGRTTPHGEAHRCHLPQGPLGRPCPFVLFLGGWRVIWRDLPMGQNLFCAWRCIP
ncbi:hypothetical protein ZEAMMB73_Zm00001d016956 [Zea mays]|uniref:Uncharacterized protein n=1 Tax=Zea mays TaxID=4577 RepID=A0A1D6HBG2_MAIZE|nr:hypothetical protein ZEAMMB73_Zm00001d016956 [Zea mays]AQK72031.1 hypothetical protein ZEAMMB73_Zm00001d016956 [Zea mays]AQK72037.1 hypothetical protein ZEAMMB73_Zm00001d016956 [Zea mays]